MQRLFARFVQKRRGGGDKLNIFLCGGGDKLNIFLCGGGDKLNIFLCGGDIEHAYRRTPNLSDTR